MSPNSPEPHVDMARERHIAYGDSEAADVDDLLSE